MFEMQSVHCKKEDRLPRIVTTGRNKNRIMVGKNELKNITIWEEIEVLK